jgi:Tfp pilus assembly protein PilX
MKKALTLLLVLTLGLVVLNLLGTRANAHSDVDGALQKIQSAESNLDDVETHLNNAEGADEDDAQDEIGSAKNSVSDVEDDLRAAKAALEG